MGHSFSLGQLETYILRDGGHQTQGTIFLLCVHLSQASPEDGFFCSEVPPPWTPQGHPEFPIYHSGGALVGVGRNGLHFYSSVSETVFAEHPPLSTDNTVAN